MNEDIASIHAINTFVAHINKSSTREDVALFNGVVALVNGPLHLQSHSQFPSGIYNPLYMFVCPGNSSGFDVSLNGTAVSVNGPLCLQFHFQPPPGAYTSIFTFIHQRVYSNFGSSFAKETTHSALLFVWFSSFRSNHPKKAVESSTATLQALIHQFSYCSSFPTTLIRHSVKLSTLGHFPTSTR